MLIIPESKGVKTKTELAITILCIQARVSQNSGSVFGPGKQIHVPSEP